MDASKSVPPAPGPPTSEPEKPEMWSRERVVTGWAQLWNLPNMLTLLRIVMIPFFWYLLMYDDGDNAATRVAATVVFVLAAITDWLDGWLARKQGLVTTFGKIADPLADKALTGVALIGLSVLGELWWWVTILIILREVGVTVIRFMVLKHGVIPASRGGKAKTAVPDGGHHDVPAAHHARDDAAVVDPQRRDGDRRDPDDADRLRLHQQGLLDTQRLEVRQGCAEGRCGRCFGVRGRADERG